MPYCQLFYHLAWSTKQREPRITPEVEPVIYNLLRTKAIGLGGTVFALNGSVEHIHLVAAIPPELRSPPLSVKSKAARQPS
jgi:putative transposase